MVDPNAYTPGGSTSSGSNSSQQSSTQQSGTQILPGMQGIYNQLLGLNQQNYGNILNAYTTGQQNLNQGLPSVYQGYTDIGKNINNTLGLGGNGWGVATPAAQQIGETFAQAQGKTQQQLVSSGLGNTSVGANLQNQNALMAGRAYGGLGAQLAQTAAGYQAQLGQAGLAARMQGLGMANSNNQNLLGHLSSYNGFSNHAGNLTGSYSSGQSYGTSQGQQSGQSQGPYSPRPGFNPGGGGMTNHPAPQQSQQDSDPYAGLYNDNVPGVNWDLYGNTIGGQGGIAGFGPDMSTFSPSGAGGDFSDQSGAGGYFGFDPNAVPQAVGGYDPSMYDAYV